MPRIAIFGGTGYLSSLIRNQNNIKKNNYTFFSRKKNSKNYINFAAYKKKNEYKEAKINVEKIEIKNFISKWITDEGSRIIYNNKITESKFSNILDLIYKKNLSLVENL